MCNLFSVVFVAGDVSDYISPAMKPTAALLTGAFSFVFADSVTAFLFCRLKIKARRWNVLQSAPRSKRACVRRPYGCVHFHVCVHMCGHCCDACKKATNAKTHTGHWMCAQREPVCLISTSPTFTSTWKNRCWKSLLPLVFISSAAVQYRPLMLPTLNLLYCLPLVSISVYLGCGWFLWVLKTI